MHANEAATSYDGVARLRKDDRSSQQVAFRHFNNYVKKTLIQFALDRAAAIGAGAAPSEGILVLDLASGRGGDIGKWLFMQSSAQESLNGPKKTVTTAVYDCYDVAPECIREAERRCKELMSTVSAPPRCQASFTVADCFAPSFLTQTLPASLHFGAYHVVTIQFAFHYACSSLDLVRSVFSAVSNALLPGGILLITTVDNAALSQRATLDQLRNKMFSITFPETPQYTMTADGKPLLALGTKYHFHLDGFVDCAEYVVPSDVIVAAAAEAKMSLCPTVSKPFAELVRDYATNWRANKGNKLSAEELELVTLYCSLCFQKAAEV